MLSAEDLKKLKARIDFKWKVQTARSWGCECVAYIDARQVMDLLDEVVGPENWQDHYREVAGNVYCDLSLRIGDDWVSKSDCGSVSAFEAEKGQASDAFKRAAVKWGVGRFLYSLKTVKVKSIENGTDNYGKPRYVPTDDKGRRVYDLTTYIRSLNPVNKPIQSRQTQQRRSASQEATKTPEEPRKDNEQPPRDTQPALKAQPKSAVPDAGKTATKEQRAEIESLATQIQLTGNHFKEWLKNTLETTWSKLTIEQAREAIDLLNQMVEDGVPELVVSWN